MIILGLSIFEQNPAAAIIKNGKLIAYAEEERFIRLKNANGHFPLRAVQFCLEKAGTKLSKVDQIAVGWDYQKYQWYMPWFSFKNFLKYWPLLINSQSDSFVMNIFSRKPALIKKKISLALNDIEKTKISEKINFYSHHRSHAASAFYLSPFKEALVLVMDGSGEERAISVYRGNQSNLDELHKINIPNSLGWYYAAFSAFLGFQPYSQAGFLMGLAAYGKVQPTMLEKLKKILRIENGEIKLNPKYTLFGEHHYHEDFSDYLTEVFGERRLQKEKITKKHRDLARTVQYHLEETVLKYLSGLKNTYQLNNLCLAGGLAQNVKLNGRIKESGLFDAIFVQPISYDGGSAIGAGLIASLEADSKKRPQPLKDVYLGPSYSNQQVEALLKNAKLKFKKTSSKKISQLTAQALADNKIVAWFQGAMEGGPRALGNRSILASPLNAKMPDLLNQKVKYRDVWRPFCPSVTKESASRYFENIGDEGAYMIVAYQVKQSMQKTIAAVTHVDGSARPQLVDRASNPRFHQLLKDFAKLTGHEILINTSLNVKGEPIACTPLDAVRCFSSTGIDVLVVGDYILYK